MHESFERRWEESAGPRASRALRGRLEELYDGYTAHEVDLAELKRSIVELMRYVTSSAGSTEANCRAADAFVCLLTVEREDLHRRLPEAFQSLLDDIGMDLLDAVRNPELAEACGASPALLLQRAKELPGRI